MSHKNCHARSKQKRRRLLLKMRNFWTRVTTKRIEKIREAQKPKGATIRLKDNKDKAANYAKLVRGHGQLWDHDFHMRLNQRQKRKLARQVPQRRKLKN